MKSSEKEIELIKQAQAGSERAFNKLFHKYKAFVDRQLMIYIHDEDEAKDLTNIVFIKVKENLHRFTNYNTFGGWLRILSRNTAIDYIRARTRNNANYSNSEICPNSTDISTTDDVATRLEIDSIFDYLKSRSTEKANVFKCIADGLTPKETAKVLNMNHNTVRSIIKRMRPEIIKIFNY